MYTNSRRPEKDGKRRNLREGLPAYAYSRYSCYALLLNIKYSNLKQFESTRLSQINFRLIGLLHFYLIRIVFFFFFLFSFKFVVIYCLIDYFFG